MVEIGSYSPAFFKMTVNVDGDIDLNSMSSKEFSVFFHEYIHFIQDFTTAAGCRRIYVYGEYLRQSVTQTTNGANNTFQVPVIIQDYVNNVMPNMKLMDNLEGDRCDVEIKSINDVMLIPESIDDKDGVMVEYQMLTLDINQGDYLSVGTFAIKESMAYLVEKLCCRKGRFEHVEVLSLGCEKEDRNSWCYLNYFRIPGLILLPCLSENADCESDLTAMREFTRLFPDHIIKPIYALPLIKKGGALHCVTWEWYESR